MRCSSSASPLCATTASRSTSVAYDAFGSKALAGYRDAFTDLSSPIYAPWFQALTALVQSFGLASPFDVRHATTFVIGLLGLAALIPIGKLAIGRWAGFVAIVLCLMTGALYGQLFFAPSNVPFMAAMTWATLAVIVMVRREVPAWWATIGAGLSPGLPWRRGRTAFSCTSI